MRTPVIVALAVGVVALAILAWARGPDAPRPEREDPARDAPDDGRTASSLRGSGPSPSRDAVVPAIGPGVAVPEDDLVPIVALPPSGIGFDVTTITPTGPVADVAIRLELATADGWRGASWDGKTGPDGHVRIGPIRAMRVPRHRARAPFLRVVAGAATSTNDRFEPAELNHYVLTHPDASFWGRGVEVDAAGVRWFDVALSPMQGVRVAGRVVSSDGRPLAGVHVTFEGARAVVGYDHTVTGPDGRFAAHAPDAGLHVIRLRALWFRERTVEVHTTSLSVPPEGLADFDLRLPPMATLFGTVRDSRGRPVAGLPLLLQPNGNVVRLSELGGPRWDGAYPQFDRRVVTGADGSFTFELPEVDPTEYEVRTEDGSPAGLVLLSSIGAGLVPVELVFDPHGVRPVVTDRASGATIDAEIDVYAPADAAKPRKRPIGWDDYGPIEDVVLAAPGARVRVVVRATGYAPRSVEHTVDAETGFDPVEIGLEPLREAATVRLHFEDPEGRPVPWPQTIVRHLQTGEARFTSRVEGATLETRDLAAGSYVVEPVESWRWFTSSATIGGPGAGAARFLLPASFPLEVPSSGVLDVGFRLERGGALELDVTGAAYGWASLDRVHFEILGASGDRPDVEIHAFGELRGGAWSENPYAEGRRQSQTLPAGRWTLRWTDAHGGRETPRAAAIDVRPGELTPVTLKVGDEEPAEEGRDR